MAEVPSSAYQAKGLPYLALDPRIGAADSVGRPLEMRLWNSVIVDVIPGPGAATTSITLLGAPLAAGNYIQEVDPQAFQSGVPATAPFRFVVTGVSAWVAVRLTAPAGWLVYLTPFNAASQTSVNVTGTTDQNLAQYGGVAVGPANPVRVDPTGTTTQPVSGSVGVTSQPARVRTTDSVAASLATDALMVGTTALTPKFASVDVATLGDNTLVTAVPAKQLRVLAYILVAAGAVAVRWKSGAATNLSGAMALAANGGIAATFVPVGLFQTVAGDALVLNLSAAVQVSGHLVYVEV